MELKLKLLMKKRVKKWNYIKNLLMQQNLRLKNSIWVTFLKTKNHPFL